MLNYTDFLKTFNANYDHFYTYDIPIEVLDESDDTELYLGRNDNGDFYFMIENVDTEIDCWYYDYLQEPELLYAKYQEVIKEYKERFED